MPRPFRPLDAVRPRADAAPVARVGNPKAPWSNQLAGHPLAQGGQVPEFSALLSHASSFEALKKHWSAQGFALRESTVGGTRTLAATSGASVDLQATFDAKGEPRTLTQQVRTAGGAERHQALFRKGAWHLMRYEADFQPADSFGRSEEQMAPWKSQFAGQKGRGGAPVRHFSEVAKHATSPEEFRKYLVSKGLIALTTEPAGDLQIQGGGLGALFSRSGAPIRVFSNVTTAGGSEQHRAEAQMGGRFHLVSYRAQYENPEAAKLTSGS